MGSIGVATGIDWSRVWDRLQKSVILTNRSDFVAIGNTAIGNADRGCLSESGIYASGFQSHATAYLKNLLPILPFLCRVFI